MVKAQVLQEQGMKQVEIACMLGVTDRTVRNYLKGKGSTKGRVCRKSKLDPYKGLVDSILEDNPFHNRELIYERLQKQGYHGGISILREYAGQTTKRITKAAVIRFETEPGRQAQVDWKEFGKKIVDGREVKLYAFVMVLGYSRKPFIRFTTSTDQSTLLACHVLAFAYFGGIPHEILYDNMRTAFHPDQEGLWQPTKRLLSCAAHYGFTPKRCKIRRPETKGKVERTIGYLDNNFWPRIEGSEFSLETLNGQVASWVDTISAKPLAELGESRAERFGREKSALKPLPARDFDVRHEFPLHVCREGTVHHESNRYTVPSSFIGDMVGLLVHPLNRSAELRFPDGSSRTFTLAERGSHARVEFPEDMVAQRHRWQEDRERIARYRRPRRVRRHQAADIDVEVRSPSVYEALSRAMAAS